MPDQDFKGTVSKVKIGTFTRDTSEASGDQAISGVGFTPKKIILLANTPGTVEVSIGLSDGVNNYCTYQTYAAGAGTWAPTTFAIYLETTGSVAYAGTVTMDSDGFTVAWTKVGAKTGTTTIHYMAL